MHFYHVSSPHPAARPLLISHGWPSTPAEFLKVIGALTDPVVHGGDAADAFHLVIPSLPGFGFSGPTRQAGVNSEAIARAFAGLMSLLGYDRYFAQGGDKGVLISMMQAALFPDRVEAIHLTLVPGVPDYGPDPRASLTLAELAMLERGDTFQREETGYQLVQRMKPQTLAYGLTDSPVALAAWLVDKYRAWSDCQGDVERRFSRDELLDIISIYWLTGTIASSMRIYFEDHAPGRQRALPNVAVPTGHSHFPAEIMYTPRRWAERRFNIRYWHEMPEGGHFPAAEVPTLFIGEMRAFFRSYR